MRYVTRSKCWWVIWLFVALFLACSVGWMSYQIQYVGSEKEKTTFVENLKKNKTPYRVYKYDSSGIYEIQYKEQIK